MQVQHGIFSIVVFRIDFQCLLLLGLKNVISCPSSLTMMNTERNHIFLFPLFQVYNYESCLFTNVL